LEIYGRVIECDKYTERKREREKEKYRDRVVALLVSMFEERKVSFVFFFGQVACQCC
jgi:hypothetical protein